MYIYKKEAPIAQLGERQIHNLKVFGSSPNGGILFRTRRRCFPFKQPTHFSQSSRVNFLHDKLLVFTGRFNK